MRTALVLLCLLLAGCGEKSPSLEPYVIPAADLEGQFTLIPMDDEDYGMFMIGAGMESNPGSVSRQTLEAQGLENVTAGYVAIYDTPDGEGMLISAATKFTSETAAGMYLLQEFECSDPVILIQNGDTVAVAFMYNISQEAKQFVEAAMEKIRLNTGSATPC